MNVIIIEDEKIAAERLRQMLLNTRANWQVVCVMQTVTKAVEWFKNNPAPGLAFFDIQLADGLSFEIFEQADVACPVIFTTAYEEYTLKAFKVNSIDYLLKPFSQVELNQAISKFENSPYYENKHQDTREIVKEVFESMKKQYKKKFVIRVNDQLKVIPVSEVQLVFSKEKATYLKNVNGRDYAVNYTLDQLELLLDPGKFFRISRKHIVSSEAIKEIKVYSTTRLLLHLHIAVDEEVVVSRERVNEFKQWMEGC